VDRLACPWYRFELSRASRATRTIYGSALISAFYESQDYGATWATSQLGPNDAPVDDLKFVGESETLLAATHGRGLYTADTSGVLTYAPVVATRNSETSILVQWTPPFGGSVTSYQVMRSSDGGAYVNATNGLVPGSTTSFTDNSNIQSGKTYLYRVKALVGSTWGDLGAPDLASMMTFTDDNALVGKVIKVQYLNEPIRAVDFQELRVK
jgi:hypothetical protein